MAFVHDHSDRTGSKQSWYAIIWWWIAFIDAFHRGPPQVNFYIVCLIQLRRLSWPFRRKSPRQSFLLSRRYQHCFNSNRWKHKCVSQHWQGRIQSRQYLPRQFLWSLGKWVSCFQKSPMGPERSMCRLPRMEKLPGRRDAQLARKPRFRIDLPLFQDNVSLWATFLTYSHISIESAIAVIVKLLQSWRKSTFSRSNNIVDNCVENIVK